MLDGGAPVNLPADGGEGLGFKALEGAESLLELRHRIGRLGHAVELDAVAGVEHGDLTEAFQRIELGVEFRKPVRREREALAHLDRCSAMVGTDQEKRGRESGHREAFTGVGERGGRLELTASSESSAAANRMMQVQARRFEMSSSLSRRPRTTA